MKDAQIKGLILRFLSSVYPHGLTLDFINALLYDWRVFCSKEELLKGHIRQMLNKGYIEIKVVEDTEKLRITEKGLALLNGELLDKEISLEV